MDDRAAISRAGNARNLANWLLGFGLALPLIAVSLNQVPARSGGQLTGKNLLFVLLALSIAGLLNKNRSVERKAKGRLVVAVLCVIVAVAGIAAIALEGGPWRRSPQELALIVRMNAETARQQATLAAIDKRFAAIALDEIMTPAALTSRTEIQAARDTLSNFMDLANERKVQSHSAAKEYLRLINQAGLDEAARLEALAAFKKKSQPTLALVGKMQRAHYRTIEACMRLIDFAESRLGQIKVVDGALVFANDADIVTLGTVLEALQFALKRQADTEALLATNAGLVAAKNPGPMHAGASITITRGSLHEGN
jgi:hypothetical protein